MRREPRRRERPSPAEMRALLEERHPAPDEPMPPRLCDPDAYAEWKARRAAARAARARLLGEHGWTMLELLQAEMAERFARLERRE